MNAEKPGRRAPAGLRYFSSTLNGKTIVAVVLVTVIMITIFVLAARHTGLKILADQARQKKIIMAVTGMAALEHEMLEHSNDGNLEHLISAMGPAVDAGLVGDVYLLDTAGALVLSISGDSIPLPILDSISGAGTIASRVSIPFEEQGRRFDYNFAPILNRPECWTCHGSQSSMRGIFGVKMSSEGMDASIALHRRVNLLAVGVLLLGLAGTIIVVLYVLVTRPIGRLHDRTERIARELPDGDDAQPHQIPLLPIPRAEDEIALLTRVFNNLLERLNQANSSLHKRHAQQLQAADRLASTGEMAAGLAHEIKNPLAGIMGAMKVIHDTVDPEDPHYPVMAEILVQLNRINKIVSDLLSFARPSQPEFATADLNELVEASLILLANQAQWKQISVSRRLSPESINLRVDRKMIKQLLWNLTTNAMQAMESTGILKVATSLQDRQAIITIQDSGPGITATVMENIFRPFYTTKTKGTGLGLAISRRIVEQHGGKLEIHSREGAGTTVNISLPVEH